MSFSAGTGRLGSVLLKKTSGLEEPVSLLPSPTVLFSIDLFIYLFVCFFVSLSVRLRENGWTDLHEIFREGVE